MKKTRLLEIIREEIASVLTEAGLGDQISALQKQKDAIEKQKAPLTKKEADVSKKIADLEKKEADAELKAGAQLEEEQLNEMAKITEPIRKGIEVAVNRMTKQKPDITPEEITKLIRNKKSQEQIAPELKAALDADEEEKGGDAKYTAGLGYPQAFGAVQIAMGLKKAKGSEPKAEKPAKAEKAPKVKAAMASKSEPMDDEDAAASKAAGSDETAKKLGSTPEEKKVKFNQFLASVNKNKDDKAKIDAILKLAKDKFKFSGALMNDLRRAAGRKVEA
jgi:hypothetical protein